MNNCETTFTHSCILTALGNLVIKIKLTHVEASVFYISFQPVQFEYMFLFLKMLITAPILKINSTHTPYPIPLS